MDTSAGGPDFLSIECLECEDQSNFNIYSHPMQKVKPRPFKVPNQKQIKICKGCMYKNKKLGGPDIKEDVCQCCKNGSEYEEPISSKFEVEGN